MFCIKGSLSQIRLKGRGRDNRAIWRHVCPGHPPLNGTGVLILHFRADVKRLDEEGKRYSWPRPARCPRCGSPRVWGHGYVGRYFEGRLRPLWMKRYRCADCGGVHTLRPTGYFRGFFYSVRTILRSLVEKLVHGRWLRWIARQVQQYWFRGFRLQSSRTRTRASPDLGTLRGLLASGGVPVSHSLECETRSL